MHCSITVLYSLHECLAKLYAFYLPMDTENTADARQEHSTATATRLAAQIPWEYALPAPLPGPYRLELRPAINTTTHSDVFDAEARRLHMSFEEAFPLDVLQELANFSTATATAWLRPAEQLDSQYFREQSERRDTIRRDEVNEYINDVVDYQQYVEDSFNEITESLSDVVEEYPLFPASSAANAENTPDFALIQGVTSGGARFTFERQAGGASERCTVGEQEYSCVRQQSDSNIVIEIRDGKAFYSTAKYIMQLAVRKPTPVVEEAGGSSSEAEGS